MVASLRSLVNNHEMWSAGERRRRSKSCAYLIVRLVALLGITSAGKVHAEVAGQSLSHPVIQNGHIRIELDAQHGALTRLTAIAPSHEFIDAGRAEGLWQITLANGTKTGPNQARKFSYSAKNGEQLSLTWSAFDQVNEPDLRVVAVISLDNGDSTSRWRISVEGLRKLAARNVVFPRVGCIAPADGESVAVPQWIGEVTPKARAIVNPAAGSASRREWDYPGTLSMQFLAYYTAAGPGFLLSTEDESFMRKRLAMWGDGTNGLGFEVIHEVPINDAAAKDYSPSYDVCLRTFGGDWFTAADLYRHWAADQPWVVASRVRKHETPAWVRDTAIWVWNRGSSAEVLAPATALERYTNLPVSVFWHWWHGCAYDVGFPEYFPPREGVEPFREAVREADANGVHAIVYMNQRLWGMTTKSWSEQNAAAAAVKQPDGTIRPEVYNTFVKAPCASMCMGTTFWRSTYAGLAEKAVKELGVAGIYMDQACTSLACYDHAHGHPLGGGAYWLDGFREMEQDIRRRCSDVKSVALAGEGCGEGWLPDLDLMLSLQVSLERYAAPGEWEPVPLFNVVYHDCATQFGNYSSLTRPPYDSLWPKVFAPAEPLALLDRKFAPQFRLEQARSFVWGQQPSIANFQTSHLESRRDEIDYVAQIARLRQRAFKYLRDGKFLRPPKIDAPQMIIPISRLSIYAGQQNAVQEYRKSVPQVLASALRADDGGTAIVLANIGESAVPLTLTLPEEDYAVPSESVVYKLTAAGRSRVQEVQSGPISLPVTLAPAETCIYEFIAK